MNLSSYIEQVGTRAFAERFGISVRTAEAYRQQRRTPRPEFAEQVVGASPVTWEGIYRPGGERSHARRRMRRGRR